MPIDVIDTIEPVGSFPVVALNHVGDASKLIDSVPTYASTAVTHNATAHSLSISLTATGVPDVAEIYFFTPATLPRNTNDLSLDLGTGTSRHPLYLPTGERATINDIHPSTLYIVLRHFENNDKRYTLTESLGQRPQDFYVLGGNTEDATITVAHLTSATASNTALINTGTFADNSYIFFAFPDFAPPVAAIYNTPITTFSSLTGFQQQMGTITATNATVGEARTYNVWRTRSLNNVLSSNRTWRIEFGPYA